MCDYTKLTKSELIARLRAIESATSLRTKESLSSKLKTPETPSLGDTEERLRAILQTAVEGIITIDEHGIVESMNPAAEKTFGYRAEEIIGKNVSLLMPSP